MSSKRPSKRASAKAKLKRAATLQRRPGRRSGTLQYNSAYVRAGQTVEKKYVDTDYATAKPSGETFNIFPTLLANVAGGTAVNQRIGNKITLTNINFRGEAHGWENTTFSLSQRLRMIVYLDTQCNGTPVQAEQLLQPKGPNGTLPPTIDSYRNMETAPRFRILKDKMMVFNPQGVDFRTASDRVTLGNCKIIKFSWKGSLPIHFGSPGAGLTEIKNNNVGVMFVWDDMSIGHLSFLCRVKYTDY